MAENEDGMEKSEEPTEERREEFRKKGDIPNSKELTSVGVLFASILILTSTAGWVYERLHKLFQKLFTMTDEFRINQENAMEFLGKVWIETVIVILPIGIAVIVISSALTLGQTRGSFTMKKLKPTLGKFNPISNLGRIFGPQSLVELSKSLLKMIII